MKVILFLLIAVLFFLGGYYLFSSKAGGHSPAEIVRMASDESAGSPSPAEKEDATSHYVSAAFGILAAFLLLKRSDNNTVALFSIAVLSTLFGRYIGPITFLDKLLGG